MRVSRRPRLEGLDCITRFHREDGIQGLNALECLAFGLENTLSHLLFHDQVDRKRGETFRTTRLKV